MKTGDNQLATDAAVLPANPSKERIAAAVQLGTIAAVPNSAPNALTARFPVVRFCSFIGFHLRGQALRNSELVNFSLCFVRDSVRPIPNSEVPDPDLCLILRHFKTSHQNPPWFGRELLQHFGPPAGPTDS